ncbi:4-oxalocrotonate tautomerase, partial [Pseudomonas aeruginosa]
MPIVNVKLLEGRSDEQLKDLVTEVTAAVEKTTGANKEAIHFVIEEMKKSHYGVAGV